MVSKALFSSNSDELRIIKSTSEEVKRIIRARYTDKLTIILSS